MKTKEEIVKNWLVRYTGAELDQFTEHIILTNFDDYLEHFAEKYGAQILDPSKAMPMAIGKDISMINFGMGSPNAATIMDLLSAVMPKSVMFLGKCGGLKKKSKIGDYILPIAAIRGDGTSNDYFPKEVPALPSFMIQRALSGRIRDADKDYWTGTVFTTNRRVWEHDAGFKKRLKKIRSIGIDMETATIFSVGFFNKIPTGALLLVTDQPMVPEGVKTIESDNHVTRSFRDEHIDIGVQSLRLIASNGRSVKHLRFE
jgi:AMP nucleosidase